jgi:hypothetical protein
MLAEALLAGEVEGIVRRVVEGALAGDPVCLRLALERLVPTAKYRPVEISWSTIEKPQDAVRAMGEVASAVARGELTPAEGGALAAIVETHRRTIETAELETRIAALEERSK